MYVYRYHSYAPVSGGERQTHASGLRRRSRPRADDGVMGMDTYKIDYYVWTHTKLSVESLWTFQIDYYVWTHTKLIIMYGHIQN